MLEFLNLWCMSLSNTHKFLLWSFLMIFVWQVIVTIIRKNGINFRSFYYFYCHWQIFKLKFVLIIYYWRQLFSLIMKLHLSEWAYICTRISLDIMYSVLRIPFSNNLQFLLELLKGLLFHSRLGFIIFNLE